MKRVSLYILLFLTTLCHSTYLCNIIPEDTGNENATHDFVYDNNSQYLQIAGITYNLKKYGVTLYPDGVLDFSSCTGTGKYLELAYYSYFFDEDSFKKRVKELCIVCKKIAEARNNTRYGGEKITCFNEILKNIKRVFKADAQKYFDIFINIIKSMLFEDGYPLFLRSIVVRADFYYYANNFCRAVFCNYNIGDEKNEEPKEGIVFGDITTRILLYGKYYKDTLSNIKNIVVYGNGFTYWFLYYYFGKFYSRNLKNVDDRITKVFTLILDWYVCQNSIDQKMILYDIKKALEVSIYCTDMKLETIDKKRQIIYILCRYGIYNEEEYRRNGMDEDILYCANLLMSLKNVRQYCYYCVDSPAYNFIVYSYPVNFISDKGNVFRN